MLEIMQKAAGRKEPAEAVRAFSEAYLRFAHQQPRVFALYLTTPGADQCARNAVRNAGVVVSLAQPESGLSVLFPLQR
jgi:hypothetical protein